MSEREILFRGKRVDNEHEWVYGNYHNHSSEKSISFYKVFVGTAMTMYAVIPETVGQYTGLTDKNGTRIFENGYMIIDNQTYKVKFDIAEYILTNIFDCDTITLKENSIKGVFVDEI